MARPLKALVLNMHIKPLGALDRQIHHVNGSQFNVMPSNSWLQPEAYGMPRDPPVMPPNTEPPPPPAIMILNDHCLALILQYLSLADQVHFARTCLRFRGVYQMATPWLHKSVDWSQFDGMTVWDVRDFFELSGCHVQKLMGMMAESRLNQLTYFLAHMHKIFSKMHKLETLELRHSFVKDDDLLALRNLRSLKTLNLDGNDLRGYTYLVCLPATIESLSLNDCSDLKHEYLTPIGKAFHQLKELSFYNNRIKGFSGFQTIIQDKSFALLETLRINVDKDEKYEFVAQLPSLKNLTIVAGPFVNSGPRIHLLEQLVKHKAKQLEQLQIHHWQLCREVLITISKLVGLHTLALHRVDSDNHLDLLSSLVNLKQFTFGNWPNVGDSAVLQLFRSCRKLDYLNLKYCENLTFKLVLGIVAQVRKEMDNKEMHRKLPIQLVVTEPFYYDTLENHDNVPKYIIKIVY